VALSEWIGKRYGDNFKSVEWLKENHGRVAWTVGSPHQYVLAPTIEELVFRAPLIIAFSTMSSGAWYGVLVSGALFALVHWFGKKILLSEVVSAKEKGSHESDDIAMEIGRLHTKEGKMIRVRKVLSVVLTFPLGILAGYYGIVYQSIWVAVGIHAAWNIFMPIVLQIIFLVGAIVFYGAPLLCNLARRKMRKSY